MIMSVVSLSIVIVLINVNCIINAAAGRCII